MKGPQSKQAEACIRNCIPTCIRGGEGTPDMLLLLAKDAEVLSMHVSLALSCCNVSWTGKMEQGFICPLGLITIFWLTSMAHSHCYS